MRSVKYAGLSLFLVSLGAHASPERCITPDKKEGGCISLDSCPGLVDALKTQRDKEVEFVRNSNCGGTKAQPKVCCSSKNAKLLLGNRDFCGYQHSDDYFRAENDTSSLDEYPWLAFLIYVDNKGRKSTRWRCSGVLISARYVLTQSRCFPGNLIGVRLGEHNFKSDTDCPETKLDLYECNLPYEEFTIENVTVYSGPERFDGHNLALLRLNQTVEYSDFIRPICLPQPSTAAKIGDTLVTSGWGFSSLFVLAAKKAKILTRLTSNAECLAELPHLKFTGKHLCTRDLDKDFSLVYNVGGPLMFSFENQWQVEGLIDLGDSRFQKHIKVANFIDWIEENVKF